MTKKSVEKREGLKSLYTRILFRLTIPLFLLAGVISTAQLIMQIQSMNRYFQMESNYTFVSAQKFLDQALLQEKMVQHPANIEPALKRVIPSTSQDTSFFIYDLYGQTALVSDTSPWTEQDTRNAEKSILLRTEKFQNYLVLLDKEKKKLVAYIPHPSDNQQHLYVTRANYPLVGIDDVLWNTRGTLLGMISLIFLTGAFIGISLAKSIVSPIRELNRATELIMKGQLGGKVTIKTGDEIQSLAEAFNHMSISLQAMKENAEDTNPLSHLPGNNGIKYNLQQRIHEKQKFVLFHTDLDRFKVFNDIYGLAKGDQAIIKTAQLIKEILDKDGDKDNFVGHQGGDDFVVIVKPKHAHEIAQAIIEKFDKELVKSLYPKEDYDRGYVELLDRRGMAERGETVAKLTKFPLLGISLAGISNSKKDFANYEDVLRATVKVKKIVKEEIKSSYLVVE